MANNDFSFVEDLNASRDLFHMKVRVIRKWRLSYRLDFIFLDEKGKKIQACVKEDLIPMFEDQLKEDGVYVIKKFGIGAQYDKYKVLDRDIKIIFYRFTIVQPVSVFQGDLYGFQFVSFDDILQNRLKDALTVDVIGRVTWCGDLDVFKSKDKESKRVNFDLEDLEGKIVKCTVWGDYATQVNAFISAYTSNEMIIAIIQHAKIKPWGGIITVQNDYNASRIFLNGDIQQVNALRRSFILKDDGSSSQSQYSSQICYPLRNEFLVKYQRRYIDQLIECPKDSYWVVLATIKMVEQEAGWFYTACRKCNRKAYNKQEYLVNAREINEEFVNGPVDNLWCFICNGVATALIPKFRVQFRVQDGTGSVSFLMFDKDVSRIVGISANDIRTKQVQSGDMHQFPNELDVLQNNFFAFIVNVSSYNVDNKHYVYTVFKFTDDPHIISQLQAAESHEDTQHISEMSSVKLAESSQCAVDSKDCASVTGDSLHAEVDKECVDSPLGKRKAESVTPTVGDQVNHDQASTTKRTRKKLLPYNV